MFKIKGLQVNESGDKAAGKGSGEKVTSAPMLWEKVAEKRLHHAPSVSENQFGLMSERSTMKIIFLLRQMRIILVK